MMLGAILAASLLVSAPASLGDAFREIGDVFEAANPGTDVELNTGGSSILARQIEHGSPSDVFASADRGHMDLLDKKGLLLPGTRRDFARNTLVLVVPAGGPARLTWKDLSARGIKRVAIGEEGVPAGNYARQVFSRLGIMDAVRPKLVMGADVRQVLAYVSQGEVDAGVVYGSDAKAAKGKVRIADRAGASWHDPIVYPIAVLGASPNAGTAKRFVGLVTGPKGRAILRKRGFMPLEAGQ